MTGVRGELVIRPITTADDAAMAAVIRRVMPEFGASGPGFAIMDPEVDAMTAAYNGPRAGYWVVERGGRIVGGGGFAQLAGGADDVCELRKMYFLDEARGLGAGRELLQLILGHARNARFSLCYLETLSNMTAARRLYEAAGFVRIEQSMGQTGHFGCDIYYARELR